MRNISDASNVSLTCMRKNDDFVYSEHIYVTLQIVLTKLKVIRQRKQRETLNSNYYKLIKKQGLLEKIVIGSKS
jgi:hypothetical protein